MWVKFLAKWNNNIKWPYWEANPQLFEYEADALTIWLCYLNSAESLNHSLTHSITHSITFSLTHSIIHSLTDLHTHPLTRSFTHATMCKITQESHPFLFLIHVTGFAKRGLPQTSKSMNLEDHNFITMKLTKLKFFLAIMLCWWFQITKFQAINYHQSEVTNRQSL